MTQTKSTGAPTDHVVRPPFRQITGETDRKGRLIHEGQDSIRCISVRTIIHYFFHELEGVEADAAKAHLESCDRCRRTLCALAIATEINNQENTAEPTAENIP